MLLRYQLNSFKKLLRREPAVAIVAAAFGGVALLVMLAIFFGLLCGFQYLGGKASLCGSPVVEQQAYFADAVTFYTLEAFFGIVFLIGIIAASITALALFYHDRGLVWLAASPWPERKILAERLPLYFLLAGWPIGILAFPGMLALGSARDAGAAFFVIGVVALLLFLLLLSGAGLILATLFVKLLGRLTQWRLLLGGMAILAVAYFGLRELFLPQELISLFQAVNLELSRSPIEPLETHFRFWPSHAFAEILFRAASNLYHGELAWTLQAAAGACAIGLFAFFLAVRWHRNLWFALQEGTFIARPKSRVQTPARVYLANPFILRSRLGALFEKDIRGLARNPRELVSAGFLLFLAVIYLSLLSVLPVHETWRESSTLPFLVALHIAGLGYFIATIGLRFIFPHIGLELQHGWIVLTSPLSRGELLYEKFVLGSGTLVLCAVVLLLFTLPALGITGLPLFLFTAFGAFQAFALASIMIGMGTFSPTRTRRDPELMTTTVPGLAATALALAYVCISGLVAWRVAEGALLARAILVDVIVAYLSLSLCFGVYFLMMAHKRLMRLDIV